jgi:Amt family ammonium transporter
MKTKIPFFLLLFIVVLCVFYPSVPLGEDKNTYDAADVAWMLTSTALVLIMTPGLAFFYGGMVKKKNVISTMLQSFICMAIIAVLWVVFGFSLVFGESLGGVIGNPLTYFMFEGVVGGPSWPGAPSIPFALFAMYQLKFAIITPALITGAFAERIRFTSYILFVCLFFIFIYAPLAHATWHPNGVLFQMGVLDFAGGTVVHMSAGVAALMSALYLKRGNDAAQHEPSHITYVLLGTGLLWFGWFGFNAGSAFGANALAASALATTSTASAAAALAWIFFDVFLGKKPSAMGASIGVVVGLVAITPAAGFVTVTHSLIIGVVAAVISRLVVAWRTRSSIDDTLDVFPSHGVGGMVGMLATGVFATSQINTAVEQEGWFFGESSLMIAHTLGLVLSVIFVAIMSLFVLWMTDKISPLRVSVEEEVAGLDSSQHDEHLTY